MQRECYRCSDKLNRPHTEHANYIRGSDTVDTEKREAFYGMQHTPETKKELDRLDSLLSERSRQALAAEIANPEAPLAIEVVDGKIVNEQEGGEVETANVTEVPFSVDEKKFQHVRVQSPNEVQDDDELALTYSLMEKQEVQKTGLVCRDCLKENDDIIWGADE